MFSKSNLTYLALVCFPLLVLFVDGFFIIPNREDYIRESLNFVLTTGFFYSLVLMIPHRKWQAYSGLIVSIILSLLLILKLSFYAIYQTKLSASALFVIFETNPEEASEFIETYLNPTFISLGIIFIVYWVVFGWFLFKRKLQFTLKLLQKFPLLSGVFFIGVAFLCAALVPWRFSDYNIIYKTRDSYRQYVSTKQLLKKNLAKPKSPFLTAVKRHEKSPKTVVVIIGESTTRDHMGIYGYFRQTTPLLNQMRDSLIVMKDVITPHVHTISALENILTFTSLDNRHPQENASIVQLANQAGYKTFWISNQRPVGINESIPTLIGYGADEKYFLNTNNYNRISHDGNLLPSLEKALNDSSAHKVVFLHLMGTHLGYDQRYPKKFAFYKDKPETKYHYDRAYRQINNYDNAVRYNDYIVSQIIEAVKRKNTSSAVVYFSDHGDDVYEVQENVGHSEDIGTKPMFQIPLIFWISDKYKPDFKLKTSQDSLENRKYLMDDFFYTFSQLLKVDFRGNNSKKSVFSKDFVEKPRIIKHSIDYDEMQ